MELQIFQNSINKQKELNFYHIYVDVLNIVHCSKQLYRIMRKKTLTTITLQMEITAILTNEPKWPSNLKK